MHQTDPPGTLLEPCNAGFIGIEWVIEDFTESEVQQSWWTVVLDILKVPPCLRRSGYAQAGTRLFQCPNRVWFGNLLQRQGLYETSALIGRWKGRAALIARGTNVILDMRVKAIRPYALVDISQLKNVSHIKNGKISID